MAMLMGIKKDGALPSNNGPETAEHHDRFAYFRGKTIPYSVISRYIIN